MKFTYIETKQKDAFEQFANNRIETTAWQMWEWANARNKDNPGLYHRVGVMDNEDNFHLTATYQISNYKFLGNVLYIPLGPIWDSKEALEVFSKNIRQAASQKNCIAVVCEPRVMQEDDRYKELLKAGFNFSGKAVQPKTTVFIDLTKSEDELLASFSRTARYNIGYAERKGTEIKEFDKPEDIQEIDKFYNLLLETQKRKYFSVQPKEYFLNIWEEFSKNGHITLYESFYNNELTATIMVMHNDTWAGSLFSSSSRKYSKTKSTYLLRWKSIQDMKAKGCKIYDLIGATDSKDESHPFYFTTQFKLAFGRELEKFAGTFEIILNPIQYTIWQTAEKLGFIKFHEQSFLKEFSKKYAEK